MKESLNHNIVNILIEAWHSEDVNYCHWKSIDHLEASYDGLTDLDILISAKDAKKAEKIAISLGFVKFYTNPLRTYPGVSDLILYDKTKDLFIHLHLHYQLVLADRWVKGFRFPIEEEILKRKVYMEEFQTWIINPVDEFRMFVCRMPLKFKNPFQKQKVLDEIKDIKQRIISVDDFDKYANEYPISFISLSKNLYTGKYDNTLLIKQVREDMYFYYLRMSKVRFKILSFIRYSYRIFVEINRRKLNNYSFGRRRFFYRGVTVAFIGMDGAGKTSAIERNKKFFAKQMDVKSVFLGSGQSGAPWYRKIIFKLLGTKAKFNKKSDNTKSDDKLIKKYPWYYIFWHLLVVRTKIKRLNQVFEYNSSCGLVFVDRWPQDTIKGTFDGIRFQNIQIDNFLEKWLQKLEQVMIKKADIYSPDIVLRFNVSPENSLKRKPEDLTLEQAKEAELNIKKIVWNSSTKVIDINSNLSIEEVDKEVRINIWNMIQEKN